MDENTIIRAIGIFQCGGMKGIPSINSDTEFKLMVKLWAELLEDIPDTVFIKACKIILASNTFFPAIAEIREKCFQIMDGFQGSGQAVFDELKSKMFKACHPAANPEEREQVVKSISDPIARQAVKIFDWGTCARDKEEKQGFHRNNFVQIYKHLAEKRDFERAASTITPEIGHQAEVLEIGEITNQIAKGF